MNKGLIILLVLLAVLFTFLAIGLRLDPTDVPSPLIGKPAPEFSAKTLDGTRTFSKQDLLGQVSLVNVWATWCPSCRAEHDVLMRIANTGIVKIYGIDWKDDPEKAKVWLAQLGDPYTLNADDQTGDIGIEFGVYGAPETYIIDQKGNISYKQTGPVTWQIWQDKILPKVKELNAQAKS